jgi:two-component system chemotaxis response regulator CheB
MRVLVVDDSAVVRQAMQQILGHGAGMEVVVAADPLIAMSKMKQARPDVIVLDLEMPRMDGLTFLRKLMAEDPIPVVICSGLGARGAQAAVRALDEGAVALVRKPQIGLQGFLHDSALRIEEAVRGAAMAKVRSRGLVSPTSVVGGHRRVESTSERSLRGVPGPLVVFGASIGGTEALREILVAMPADCPGIVIVQHMPEGFTRAFAERLDGLCRIEVKEAANGDVVRPGRALVAPGNLHTSVVRDGQSYAVEVSAGPLVSRHRPSVDVLLLSAAAAAGALGIGVILTGMGSDGARGLLQMKKAGARTIAQDEETCVVFGMPKEAVAAGAVQEIVPLPRIATAVLSSPPHRATAPR